MPQGLASGPTCRRAVPGHRLRSVRTSELSDVRYTMHGRGLSAWQYCSAARTQQMTALCVTALINIVILP